MLKKSWKLMAVTCLSGFFLSLGQVETKAASTYAKNQVGVETSSSYMIRIDAPSAKLYATGNEHSVVIGSVQQGKTYSVLSYGDGWAKVAIEDTAGYIRIAGQATIIETTKQIVDEEAQLRKEVVEYALQFVGNRYVYGGSDPHTGADCSGFTSYVMRHKAGVFLSHSSAAQAGEGRNVGIGNAKPGDLVFYGDGGRINHVAIYIGDGQIVHASTAKTGIKVSKWNHRTPVKVVDVLS